MKTFYFHIFIKLTKSFNLNSHKIKLLIIIFDIIQNFLIFYY